MMEIELIILGMGGFVTGLVTLAMIQIGRIEDSLSESHRSKARVPRQTKAEAPAPEALAPNPSPQAA